VKAPRINVVSALLLAWIAVATVAYLAQFRAHFGPVLQTFGLA
jgi:hypothetical protein